MIEHIQSSAFIPFKHFDVEFKKTENQNEKLANTQLFTGVNGTGKSRLLSLLACALCDNTSFKYRSKTNIQFTAFRSDIGLFKSNTGYGIAQLHASQPKIPTLAYGSGAYVCDSTVTAMGDIQPYDLAKALSFGRLATDANLLLQAIANMKIQSAMDILNQTEKNNNQSLVGRLEATISEVSGREFAFKLTSHPKINISAKWGNKEIDFNSLPDGLRMIIGWLAHAVVYTDLFWKNQKDPTQEEAIFLFDEIETHLHPAWQRKILPAFQKLFPKAQIFVATHSPFVISSLNEGWIYKLEPDEDGLVTISEPIAASKGDSYITAVEEILGVNEWYDTETEDLLQQFRDLRDAGIKGDENEREKAITLAQEIAGRSHELAVMMGAEIKQLNKILAS